MTSPNEFGQTDALVGVIMGSRNDWETMKAASEVLAELDIPHEKRVVSAHRTPARMIAYAQSAEQRGLRVIIAGAGGAAQAEAAGDSQCHCVLQEILRNEQSQLC